MSIRHLNRNRSKIVPNAWARCTTRPMHTRSKKRSSKLKRDQRVVDRREAKLNREKALARSFVGAAI